MSCLSEGTPIPEPIGTICQLNPQKTLIIVKFDSKYNTLNLYKCFDDVACKTVALLLRSQCANGGFVFFHNWRYVLDCLHRGTQPHNEMTLGALSSVGIISPISPTIYDVDVTLQSTVYPIKCVRIFSVLGTAVMLSYFVHIFNTTYRYFMD